jgi:hypothetical protein
MMILKGLPGIFISNGKRGEESKTAERQRESMCVQEAEHCRERKRALAIK